MTASAHGRSRARAPALVRACVQRRASGRDSCATRAGRADPRAALRVLRVLHVLRRAAQVARAHRRPAAVGCAGGPVDGAAVGGVRLAAQHRRGRGDPGCVRPAADSLLHDVHEGQPARASRPCDRHDACVHRAAATYVRRARVRACARVCSLAAAQWLATRAWSARAVRTVCAACRRAAPR